MSEFLSISGLRLLTCFPKVSVGVGITHLLCAVLGLQQVRGYPMWVPLYLAPAIWIVGWFAPLAFWLMLEDRHRRHPMQAIFLYCLLASSAFGFFSGYAGWRAFSTETRVRQSSLVP